MLDTQVMAAFAGIGISMGFAKLVSHYLNIELTKALPEPIGLPDR